MSTSNIKIYVSCHKPSYVPANPCLYPVQVGAALAKERIPGILHDDEGEHISDKNRCYCELTAQYWAWKNEDADYYGFFHYRRYLVFDETRRDEDAYGNLNFQKPDEDVIREIGLKPDNMQRMISGCDIMTVRGRKLPQSGQARTTNYTQYGTTSFQHQSDMDTVLAVLNEKYPEYSDAAKEYMDSDAAYECNMFIMTKVLYQRYCSWLFDILFEAEKRIDMTYYSVEEYRVMGYLSERLFGIFYTKLKQEGVKSIEVCKTLFSDTDPKLTLQQIREDAIPIVMAADNHFAPYLDVMIHSVMANASKSRFYDVIILHRDITEETKIRMQRGLAGNENLSLRFVKVSEYFDTGKFFVDQHLSIETYYRLMIPELMPGYHKILYLDCDMVMDADVADLYDMDLEGCVIGAARDIDVAGQVRLGINDWAQYATKTLGLTSPHDYFQAGVLVIDLDALRKITDSNKMMKLAMSQSFRCHDQDVLNIICKGSVKYLPQEWNTLMLWRDGARGREPIVKMAPRELYGEYLEARRHPRIIHFAGYQKPWTVVDCDFADYFWKYAKESPFYPLLLHGIVCSMEEIGTQTAAVGPRRRVLYHVIDCLLPQETRRRAIVSRIWRKLRGRG